MEISHLRFPQIWLFTWYNNGIIDKEEYKDEKKKNPTDTPTYFGVGYCHPVFN